MNTGGHGFWGGSRKGRGGREGLLREGVHEILVWDQLEGMFCECLDVRVRVLHELPQERHTVRTELGQGGDKVTAVWVLFVGCCGTDRRHGNITHEQESCCGALGE